VCHRVGGGRGKWDIFSKGISGGYGHFFYRLNGLNGLNVERPCEAGSVKFLTTFVGRVLPLSGTQLHTFHRRDAKVAKRIGHGLRGLHGEREKPEQMQGGMGKKNTAGFVRPQRTMPCHGRQETEGDK